jgi:hypothetical protein
MNYYFEGPLNMFNTLNHDLVLAHIGLEGVENTFISE